MIGILNRGQPWHEKPHTLQLPVYEPPRWSVMLDWPYMREARETGMQDLTPWRLNVWTPWGFLGIALTPGSRWVSDWRPDLGRYVDRTAWLQWASR